VRRRRRRRGRVQGGRLYGRFCEGAESQTTPRGAHAVPQARRGLGETARVRARRRTRRNRALGHDHRNRAAHRR
jgi:hypothetical protein